MVATTFTPLALKGHRHTLKLNGPIIKNLRCYSTYLCIELWHGDVCWGGKMHVCMHAWLLIYINYYCIIYLSNVADVTLRHFPHQHILITRKGHHDSAAPSKRLARSRCRLLISPSDWMTIFMFDEKIGLAVENQMIEIDSKFSSCKSNTEIAAFIESCTYCDLITENRRGWASPPGPLYIEGEYMRQSANWMQPIAS